MKHQFRQGRSVHSIRKIFGLPIRNIATAFTTRILHASTIYSALPLLTNSSLQLIIHNRKHDFSISLLTARLSHPACQKASPSIRIYHDFCWIFCIVCCPLPVRWPHSALMWSSLSAANEIAPGPMARAALRRERKMYTVNYCQRSSRPPKPYRNCP